jgi:leader peptidase (prepilin peptidase)/N-methyltransferase
MSIVVAGLELVLALIAGAVSFAATPYIKNVRRISDNDEAGDDPAPAATFASFFQVSSWKQWVLILIGSLLCTVSVYQLYNAGMSVIELCKYSAVALFLLSVMIIDWKTHLIPNKLVIALFGVGTILLAIEFILYRSVALQTFLLSVVGMLCCLVLFYILSRLTKDGISMGDVKLIAAMGWVLGISTTFFAVFFAMLICTIAAIFLLLSKRKNKSDRVAFGPFMFFGYILLLMLNSL